MRRQAPLLIAVLALAAGACGAPDVALGTGDGATPAPAVANPPSEPPFLEGPLLAVTTTEPVTTDCVSESDLDPDGAVSSNDPPVCNPNPSTYGSLHVKGTNASQGGETEIVATVNKTVPVVREGAGGKLEPVRFSELAKGDVISLWITGEVMESYPLQGTATYVLVEER